jgi:CubicO group peptidase (beta-lactamase class C family)
VRRDGPVGREWRYSGGGYLVLQQLLEDVTGQDFAGLAAELRALAGAEPGCPL